MAKTITREEGKLITRRRLLESAAKVLGETGYGALSVSAVTRAAGAASDPGTIEESLRMISSWIGSRRQ